jgi:hypothetical protein
MPDDQVARRATPPALELRSKDDAAEAQRPHVHNYGGGKLCMTDTRGHPTPEGRSPIDLVVHAPDGFIPLWDADVMLRWRFQEQSMLGFADPEAAKDYVRDLFGKAILLWGEAAPVRFTEAHDAWDFEIVVRAEPSCSINGCTLARAFFPDAGRHELVIFPTMFDQTEQEQVETLAHEIGHIFGLRHFFAQVAEQTPSEIFGTHNRFTIMNYGADSRMSPEDQADLRALYVGVWSGQLTHINGTRIALTRPFSAARATLVAAHPALMRRPAA